MDRVRLNMKKLIATIGLLIASGLWAQTNVVGSSVRVYTEPGGARFLVDGVTYYASQTFTWPAGSKHVIEFPLKQRTDGGFENFQESLDRQSQFSFGGWQDSTGTPHASNAIIVAAEPNLKWIKASAPAAYRVSVRFSAFPKSTNCTPDGPIPQDAVRTGLIVVGGACFGSDGEAFLPAGTIQLQAIAFPGSVFLGWSVNGSTSNAATRSHTLNGPTTIAAQFTQSKRVQFLTEPPGFNVLVDRSPTPTSDRFVVADDRPGVGNPTCQSNLNLPPNPPLTIPVLCFGEFDFIPGSRHTIGAPSPQYTRTGDMFVFDKFSNGQGDNAVFVAGTNVGVRDLLTANFVPGVNASFLTNPPNLKLVINNRDTLFLNYNFAWGIGHTHVVSAPAEQRDANGRRWTFKSWSNGGPATQSLTVSGPIRMTATYEALPQVVITSIPSGLPVNVDGRDCPTPCTVDKAAGSEVQVRAARTISMSPQSRYEFQGWGDSASNSRVITLDADRQVFVAQYSMAHQLSAFGDPANGVTFVSEPSSEDGFYAADAVVRIRAEAKNGFRFRRWDGDLAGTFNQGTIVMTSPRTVLAKLDKVPFIPPAGIRNAAGETPDRTVAPGSIISILGESLAAEYVAGRTNPLQQTLGNVTVRVGESLLPLLWVSPTEIRAQVLSTLPDGEHELRVRWEGNPEVVGKFTVSRNSPGLFSRDDEPIALATREDGSQITPQSPARRGELVTLYGTGFGPYERVVVDGFLNTLAIGNALVDRLDIFAGDRMIQPDWSGAALNEVGLAVTRFRVPSDMSGEVPLEFRVVVNGKSSNSVVIPIQ
jgi:uncharacterized protein (TIGR03437 family)